MSRDDQMGFDEVLANAAADIELQSDYKELEEMGIKTLSHFMQRKDHLEREKEAAPMLLRLFWNRQIAKNNKIIAETKKLIHENNAHLIR